MNSAPAVVVVAPGQAEVQDLSFPNPGPGQVLIRTAFSVTSPGTERRVFDNTQPNLSYPLIPGYAAAGVVEKAGAHASLTTGQAVVAGGIKPPGIAVAWGGHAGLILADASACQPVPEGVTLKHAAITKLAAIAQHGVTLASIQPGDRVAVIGLGLIGQLVARLVASLPDVVLATGDLAAHRVAAASAVGVLAVELTPGLTEWPDDEFDLVFDATGVPAVAPDAIRLLRARPWGTPPDRPPALIVQGSYPGDFHLPYIPAFRKEMRVLISRDEGPGDRVAVLEALKNQRLPVGDLVEAELDPAVLTHPPEDDRCLTRALRWSAA